MRLRHYKGDRRGSIPVMVALLLVPMVVATGGAIDLTMFEIARAKVQGSLDRGVLAAASLSQTQETRTVIEQYLKSDNVDPSGLQIVEQKSNSFRNISGKLSIRVDNIFLRLINQNYFTATVESTAEEKRQNIEISMMLDISDSMAEGKPTKVSLLKPAAKDFVDEMMEDGKDQYTSISIVPYAGSVSWGKEVFDLLSKKAKKDNPYSSCFEMGNSEYNATGPFSFATRDQVPHFTKYHYGEKGLVQSPWWCPDDPHAALSPSNDAYVAGEGNDPDDTSISFLSNKASLLKDRIDQYRLYDGTGTQIATRWGLYLLDPAAQPLVKVIAGNASDAEKRGIDFSMTKRPQGFPAPFGDPNTVKYMILMTDGATTGQHRPTGGKYVSYTNPPQTTETVSEKDAKAQLQTTCTLAKDNKVVIFTIGFQVSDDARKQLRNCASMPKYFYDVQGMNIAEAFNSIASTIQKLKLVG